MADARRERLQASVPEHLAGERLDRVLAELFPDFSRSRLQQWVKDGRCDLDGHAARNKDKVVAGQEIRLDAEFADQVTPHAQDIPLDVVFEDDALIVINKPPGLVVHPAAGNPDGTLQNALLHHDLGLRELPRAGIVHRLDKDTSGLLVVARTPAAHHHLVDELQERAIHREYRAVVAGAMVAGGTVDAPIGRHRVQRTRMAVTSAGKPAVTEYRVLERYRAHTLLQLKLQSGRTHQIRVHMAHIHYPIVGDPVYGGRLRMPSGASERLRAALQGFRRQALHAFRLGLKHPVSGEWLEWTVPVPADMAALIEALRADAP
jgi:23S rRNA pseudouridine1911/1915/1917 synthase